MSETPRHDGISRDDWATTRTPTPGSSRKPSDHGEDRTADTTTTAPSRSHHHESDLDKYAILFSPSTPRASPVAQPQPLPHSDADDSAPPTTTTMGTVQGPLKTFQPDIHAQHHPLPQPLQHKRSVSEDSDFGSFVSVSNEDDPLSSTFSTFGDLPPSFTPPSTATSTQNPPTSSDLIEIDDSPHAVAAPHPPPAAITSKQPPGPDPLLRSGDASTANASLNFFDRFAAEAKLATEEKRKSVLDELLMHEDDPMYFLAPGPSSTPKPDEPKEVQLPLRASPQPLPPPASTSPSPSPPIPVTSAQGPPSPPSDDIDPHPRRLSDPPDLPLLVDLENDVDADYFHPRHASGDSNSNSRTSTPYDSRNYNRRHQHSPERIRGHDHRSVSTSPMRTPSLPVPPPPGVAPPVSSSPEAVYFQHLNTGDREEPGQDQAQHQRQQHIRSSSSYQSLTSLTGKWMSSLLRGSHNPTTATGSTSTTTSPTFGTQSGRPGLDSIFHPGHDADQGAGPVTATHSLRRTISGDSSGAPGSGSPLTSSHIRSATHPHSTSTSASIVHNRRPHTHEPHHAQNKAIPPHPVQFTHDSPFSSTLSSPYTSPFSSTFSTSNAASNPGGGSLPIPGTTWSTTGTVNLSGNPFGPHVYFAPSGAPGFAGEFGPDGGWDKRGFGDELGREWERVKSGATGAEKVEDGGGPSTGARGRGGSDGSRYSHMTDRSGMAASSTSSTATTGTRKPPGITSVGDLIDQRVGGGQVELVGRKASTSAVLTEDLASRIRTYFPALHRLSKKWTLVYSLDQHGISLNTLYNHCEARLSPTASGGRSTVLSPTGTSISMTNKACLLVVKDSEGTLFGAWLGEGIARGKARVGGGSGFFGSGESFLWKWTPSSPGAEGGNGNLKIFKTTGRNSYIALCDVDYLALGGGDGSYGLYLDESLYEGSSAPCLTFGNEVLCSPGPKKAGGAVEFECVGLEVWGMA